MQNAERPDNKEYLSTQAIFGLLNGDLRPLCAYIRAGHDIDFLMADQIADLIDGANQCPFHLKLVGKPGKIGWSDQAKIENKRQQIALHYLRMKNSFGKGSSEGVMEDTMSRFGVKKSAVYDAVKAISQRPYDPMTAASRGCGAMVLYAKTLGFVDKG